MEKKDKGCILVIYPKTDVDAHTLGRNIQESFVLYGNSVYRGVDVLYGSTEDPENGQATIEISLVNVAIKDKSGETDYNLTYLTKEQRSWLDNHTWIFEWELIKPA